MDQYLISSFIESEFPIVALSGFASGLIVSALVMSIRALSNLFRKVMR